MLAYIHGRVLRPLVLQEDSKVVVGVGSGGADSGVLGYSIQVPTGIEYQELKKGQWVEFELHTHVREDALDLFGFLTTLEKELFHSLLSVNGIGPKLAMGLLSALPPRTLIEAVLHQDRDVLVKIPGVGKKTVERLLIELVDRFKKKFGDLRSSDRPLRSGTTLDSVGESVGLMNDVRAALVGLGYREQEVTSWLSGVIREKGSNLKPEELVRQGLRELGA